MVTFQAHDVSIRVYLGHLAQLLPHRTLAYIFKK